MPELQTPPFGYAKKMIVVKNSGLFKKETKRKVPGLKELRETLEKYLKENIYDIKQNAVIIFIEDSIEKLKITKKIEELRWNNTRIRTTKANTNRKKTKRNMQCIQSKSRTRSNKRTNRNLRSKYARTNKRNKKTNRICRRRTEQ